MSEKVTYGEIIEALSRKSGQSKQKSEAFTKALIAEIKNELRETGKASITNFGSFKVKEVAEREGQNPQTGEPITIPAHKRVSFSPYKALRETVNKKYAHLETKLVQDEKTNNADKKPQVKAEQTKTSYSDKKGMSATKKTLGILIPAIMLILIALFLLFDPLGTDKAETSSAQVQSNTEMPAQTEAPQPDSETNDTAQETDPAATTTETEQPDETLIESQVSEVEDEPVSVESTVSEVTYQVNQNEWYWLISENIYGNAQFWPLLFQQNQSANDNPDQLYPSSGLDVPQLEGTAQNPSAADYQKLAEATKMVSKAYENAGKPDKAEAYARLAAKWEREIQ